MIVCVCYNINTEEAKLRISEFPSAKEAFISLGYPRCYKCVSEWKRLDQEIKVQKTSC